MCAILLTALVLGADVEPQGPPKGQPPLILMAKISGDQLVHRTVVTSFRQVVQEREVNVNGRVVKEKVTVVVPILVEVEQLWDLTKGSMKTAGGKKLTLADLKKRLEKPALVVVSSDGKAIDPAFVKVFAKDAILITAPRIVPKNTPKSDTQEVIEEGGSVMSVILLAALVVGADTEPKGAPRGQAPMIVKAQVSGDKLVERVTKTMYVPVVEERVVVVNGQQVKQTVTVVVPQVHVVELSWDLKKGTATTAGGKKLTLADLKRRLEKPTLVIVSSDGKAIDAGFVRVFAKDTILITAPMVGPDLNLPVPTPAPAPRPKQ